jgi:ankyrin repeat protein
MVRMARAAALLAVVMAAPAAAQFSDAYNFLKAVRDRDVLTAKQLLDKPGSIVVNTRDRDTGEAALHIVTKRRDTPWMGFLLQNGADPNIRDNEGNTPLIVAAQAGFFEGVRLMLAGKASVNLVNNRGQSALFKSVEARDPQSVRLLLDAGADPDLPEHQTGQSARDLAAADPRSGQVGKMLAEAPKKARRAVAGPTL